MSRTIDEMDYILSLIGNESRPRLVHFEKKVESASLKFHHLLYWFEMIVVFLFCFILILVAKIIVFYLFL